MNNKNNENNNLTLYNRTIRDNPPHWNSTRVSPHYRGLYRSIIVKAPESVTVSLGTCTCTCRLV